MHAKILHCLLIIYLVLSRITPQLNVDLRLMKQFNIIIIINGESYICNNKVHSLYARDQAQVPL